MDFIKDEIEIDETPILSLKEEFPSETAVEPLVQQVKNENDECDMDFIKNEIDIDAMPIQSVKRESPSNIAEDPLNYQVKSVNDDEDNDDDDDDIVDYIMKDEIDIDETPLLSFKEEFYSNFAVEPVKQKSEHHLSWESLQFFYDLELKVCGRVAVVSLSRLEDEDFYHSDSELEGELQEISRKEHDRNFKTPRKGWSSWLNGGRVAVVSLSRLEDEDFYHSDSELEGELQEISRKEHDRNFKTPRKGWSSWLNGGRVAVVSLSRLEDEDFYHSDSELEGELQEISRKEHDRNFKTPRKGWSSWLNESLDNRDARPREGTRLLKSLREYRMNKARQEKYTKVQNSTAEEGCSSFTQDSEANKYTNIKTFKCSLCRFKCHSETSLVIHLRSHTWKESVCMVCGYMSRCASTLLIHSRIHSGDKPYKCDICDYKCTQSSHLYRHKRNHTGEKPFGCTICNSKFSERRGLTNHMSVHNGVKRARKKRVQKSCSVCHLKFNASYLKEHERTHSGVKPYNCDMCDFKSSSSSYLKKHKRVHTGDEFSCTECNYKCFTSSDFFKHRRIHSNEKPYSCDMCGYRSIRLNHLKQHIRKHTGEKPFQCDMCDYKYSSSSGLNTHRRTHTVVKTDN